MDNPKIKNLSTLAVATITTGVVLVDGFEGVPEAFEHILGFPVWTHEMPSLGDAAKAAVLAQYPDFPSEYPADLPKERVRDFMAEVLTVWGREIEIERGAGIRTAGPVTTLSSILTERPDVTVIVVETPEQEGPDNG